LEVAQHKRVLLCAPVGSTNVQVIGRAAFVVALSIAALPAQAAEDHPLGLVLAEIEGEIWIIAVDEEGRAARAHVETGQRLLAIGGQPVTTLEEVGRILEATGGGHAFDLQVADSPYAGIGRPNFRVGLKALFMPISGQESTISARFWGHFDLRLAGGVWLGLGAGYIPLGREAFVSGRDLLTANLSLEYERPLFFRGFAAFVRALSGVQLPLDRQERWEVLPVSIGLETGARFRFGEAFVTGGWGPARGFNAGLGVGIYFEIHPSPSAARY
jgi:hypothetical protein